MKRYYEYAQKTICFDFPEELNVVSLKQHLPQIKLIDEPQNVNILISFRPSSNSNLVFDLYKLDIYDLWDNSWLIDLPHLIYSYLKYVLFHQHYYSIHSCVIDETLFIGHSGSGKTSLCIHGLNNNKKISSLDRSVVYFDNNKLNIIAGTDVLSVRKEQKQPKLPLIFENNERIIYNYPLNVSNKLSKIVLFQISDNEKLNKIEGLSIVHQLFPFFIDNIKTDCFVQSGQLLFCPIYSELIKKDLFKELENLSLDVFFASGSLDYLINL